MSESDDGSISSEGMVEGRLIETEERVEGNVSALFFQLLRVKTIYELVSLYVGEIRSVQILRDRDGFSFCRDDDFIKFYAARIHRRFRLLVISVVQ